jgi:Methylase involved in ubiquinone/menaquinone biosynthesis
VERAGKQDFLDLGCGMGRHSILFGKNGFHVYCYDLSGEAVRSTREWAEQEGLTFEYAVGDMLSLPYADESFDCIMCRNVISHSDTKGVVQTAAEIHRVLRPGGECFLTLASKDTWGWKQEEWPLLDSNTRVRMNEGPEKGIPHFYADRRDAKELFRDFETVSLSQVETWYDHDGQEYNSAHFHILIRK